MRIVIHRFVFKNPRETSNFKKTKKEVRVGVYVGGWFVGYVDTE